MRIKKLAKECHKNAIEKGWWQGGINSASVGNQFANFHSEISEAWEEYRKGHNLNHIYYVMNKPEGIPIELADCIIRILDTCEAYGIDIVCALKLKMAYNKSRPYRHGNKIA